jgi:hypothetical protein
MFLRSYVIVVLIIEILLFLVELILSVTSPKNRELRKADKLEQISFIDLSEGYRTSISIFRISLFISFILLLVLNIGHFSFGNIESFLLVVVAFLLVYLVSLFNIKTFIFYDEYFIVSAPFNPFRANTMIEYENLHDFRLFRALYNSYYLSIELKNGEKKKIQFSASFLPRNDLSIRIILNSKAQLGKDFRKLHKEEDFL